jgi:AcrR family transcriptional regulator
MVTILAILVSTAGFQSLPKVISGKTKVYSSMTAVTKLVLDKRIQNTIQTTQNALVELLAQGYAHSDITITLLAKQAGITRKAFYDRFGSVNRVFVSLGEKVFLGVGQLVADEELKLPLAESSLGLTIIGSFASHPFDVVLLMRNMPGELIDNAVREATSSILERALQVNEIYGLTPTEHEYLVRYSAGSLSGVIGAWGDRAFSDTPEAVGKFFSSLFFPGIDQFLMQKKNNQFNFNENSDHE